MMDVSSATLGAMKKSHVANKNMNSNLEFDDGNDMKSQNFSADPDPPSSTTKSSLQRADTALKPCEESSSDDTTSQHSETTLKRSNSWSEMVNAEGDSVEANVVPKRPQSSRLPASTGDNQSSVKKSKRSKSRKSKVRTKIPSSKARQGDSKEGDEGLSDLGTWRPLIHSETKMSAKRSSRIIDKEKAANGEMVESSPKSTITADRKRQPSKRGDDYGASSLKNHTKDIATEPPARSSALTRSLSLPSLEVESTSTSSRGIKQGDRRKDRERRRGSSPRRGPRSKKDLLSFSEHLPKSSRQTHGSRTASSLHHSLSNQDTRVVPDTMPVTESQDTGVTASTTVKRGRSLARDKLSHSEHAKSKPARRGQLSDEQAPGEKHTNMEDRKRNKSRRQEGNALRRSRSTDSQSQRTGRSSFLSSWGDLTLDCETGLEDASLKKKKNWKAQCSWDLSQLILMEELLSAQPEKPSSRKEKVKDALFTLTKKILAGPRKEGSETNPRFVMQDSCRNNVSLFDDSYQQNFASTNVDFGTFESRTVDHENGVVLLSNEQSTEVTGPPRTTTRSRVDRNKSKEGQDVKPSDADTQGFCSARSLLETSKVVDGLLPPKPPSNQGSSSSSRRGRNKGRADNKDKKPSSWRELYKQMSPGQANPSQQRRGNSLVRKQSLKRLTEQRPTSFDDDFVSPRTVTTVFPSSIETVAHVGSDSSKGSATEKFSTPTRTSAGQRRARQRISGSGNTPGSRELDLLQW